MGLSYKRLQKRCSMCDRIRSIRHFVKNKNQADGYLTFCKECRRKRRIGQGEYEMFSKKRAIVSLIKNEVLRLPTIGTKGLWDGRGDWSKKYDVCVECNTNIYKHHGNGLCEKCRRKLYMTVYLKKYRELNKEKLRKQARRKGLKHRTLCKRVFDAVLSGEVPMTDKIENLLSNYEKIT